MPYRRGRPSGRPRCVPGEGEHARGAVPTDGPGTLAFMVPPPGAAQTAAAGARRRREAPPDSSTAIARGLLAAPVAALAVWAIATLTGAGALLWLEIPTAVLAATVARSGRLLALLAAPAALALAVPLTPGAPPPALALLVLALSAAAVFPLAARLHEERLSLRSLTERDALTGAGNLRLLRTRLEYEAERHRRHERRLALLTLDLDGFKQVNDRFGHPAGDELLREVAHAIGHAVRVQDTVVRQGGDEFSVLAPETGPAGAERLAARIEQAIARAGPLGRLGASVGYAIFPDDGADFATLRASADAAQVEAKRARREAAAELRAA